MNEYARGALDMLQIVKETIIGIADIPIDLPTALAKLESGVRLAGELRDAMIGGDARLIAAVHDLLAVCEKLAEADKLALPDGTMYIEYIDVVAEARDMARAAIEKVEGEQS